MQTIQLSKNILHISNRIYNRIKYDNHLEKFVKAHASELDVYFDESYYLKENPDVKASGVNPLQHYLTYGWKEGRNPSACFDTHFYLEEYSDAAATNVCPLIHYIQYGKKERRPTSACEKFIKAHALELYDYFDESYYLEENPDVKASGVNPLQHYLTCGWMENRNPSACFDTHFYLEEYRDVAATNICPLIHYIQYGKKENRATCANVSILAYKDVKNRFIFSPDELEVQKRDLFSLMLTISIIVPLYNTPEKFLTEMISSVQSQTYGKWELCLADGSDETHNYVGNLCREYAHKDSRIKYRKLEKNSGIAGNTNECLKMSTGDYIAFLDHDDILHPAALHEVMKAICEGSADFIYTDEATFSQNPSDAFLPHFKPDYAPDNLLASNYICHFTVVSRKIYETIGGIRSGFDGSQDHDFVMRATEVAGCIAHIPEVLYFWRSHPGSVASGAGAKSYAATAGHKAVKSHINALGIKGTVTSTDICPSIYRITYELISHPKISIIIPNYEHLDDLKKCIGSILENSTYDNYEIVIVENNSRSSELFDYYEQISDNNSNVKIVVRDGNFNYSAICNFGVKNSAGEVLLFLNNDTEVISPGWLEEMLMFAQRKNVGAVGAKLYYPDGRIQHAGVLLGAGGIAGHYFCYVDGKSEGYMGKLGYAQDQTAVTGACMMIRREVFNEVGRFYEDLAIAFNDVDFCLRLRKAGYLNIWTPFAELYHYESASRGYEDTPEKQRRFKSECRIMDERWHEELAYGDPYYNPNFDLYKASFEYKSESRPYEPRYYRKEQKYNAN